VMEGQLTATHGRMDRLAGCGSAYEIRKAERNNSAKAIASLPGEVDAKTIYDALTEEDRLLSRCDLISKLSGSSKRAGIAVRCG